MRTLTLTALFALVALVALVVSPAFAADRALKITAGAPADPELNVTLRVVTLSTGVRRPVSPGETLRSGDRVELLVEVDKPAYVYVAQVFADGGAAILFPEAAVDFKVSADTSTRIPPEGKWFELDDNIGDEHVVLVVATRPIDEADEEAKRVLDEIRKPAPRASASRGKGKRKSASMAALSLRTRGMVVKGEDATIKVRTDERGVAVYRFSFKHAK